MALWSRSALAASFLRRREPPDRQLLTGPVVAALILLVARWSGRSWTEIGLTFRGAAVGGRGACC